MSGCLVSDVVYSRRGEGARRLIESDFPRNHIRAAPVEIAILIACLPGPTAGHILRFACGPESSRTGDCDLRTILCQCRRFSSRLEGGGREAGEADNVPLRLGLCSVRHLTPD